MTTRWRIEGELTLAQAPRLKAGLAAALEGDGPLEVDLTGVTLVDGAGQGLLRLARRLAERHGRTLTFPGSRTPAPLPSPVEWELLPMGSHDADPWGAS